MPGEAAAAGALGPAALIPAALGVLTGGAQAISSAIGLKKDRKELDRLKQPFYKVQDEYYRNNNQAAELASGGITQGAKDFYSDMAGRGLGAGISGVLQAGGSPNDISKIFDSYNTSIRKLGVDDAEAQINNIKYYHQTNRDLAGQKTQQWAINEYQPYQNKLKDLTERVAANKANIWKGVQGVVGSVQAGVTASQNNKLLDNLFKGSAGDPTGGFGTSIAKSAFRTAASSVAGKLRDPFSSNSDSTSNDGSGVHQEEFLDMVSSMSPEEFSDYMNQFSSGTKQF